MAETYRSLGYQQITGLNTVKGLTVPVGALVAHIQAETQSVRWRDDGTDPTTAVGTVLTAGADMLYSGSLSKLKIIETAASAKLNVHYYA